MRLTSVGLMLLIGCWSVASAATITVGVNNNNNTFPFTRVTYTGEYQQLYSSTAFSGPVTITGLEFASASGFFGPTTDTFTATIGLSTTSTSLANMSTTYAANEGADFAQVFSGTVNYTSTGTDTFDLIFATSPFSYDPGLGNLLMDVVISGNPTADISMDATAGSAVTSRVYNFGGSGAPTFGQGSGLVTGFVVTAATPTPEPGTMALFGAGFACLLFAGRRVVRPHRHQ